jgi:hypothetical protein
VVSDGVTVIGPFVGNRHKFGHKWDKWRGIEDKSSITSNFSAVKEVSAGQDKMAAN